MKSAITYTIAALIIGLMLTLVYITCFKKITPVKMNGVIIYQEDGQEIQKAKKKLIEHGVISCEGIQNR